MQFSLRALAVTVLAASSAQVAGATDSWIAHYTAAKQRVDSACNAERVRDCESALQRLQILVGGRPEISCRLGEVQAKLGETDIALDNLRVCAGSGLDFPQLVTEPALRRFDLNPAFAAVERAYKQGSLPIGEPESRYSLGDSDLLAEDIAFDSTDGSFLVSSIRERKIVRVSAKGAVSDFITSQSSPLWGLFAVSIDARRGTCWVTTAAVAQSPPFVAAEEGRSAVLRFDLRSARLLHRYELMDGKPHAFGDMTLAQDGTAYVSDGLGGGVYVIRADHPEALRVLVGPGSFRSPQTPAVIARKRVLLIPDYSRGIGIVSLAAENPVVTWLEHPAELSLAGIDGLYVRGHTLVAVQNGTAPERILIMTLDEGYRRVIEWRVALARVSGLGDPTHGVILGDRFFALVNSGWDRMNDDGTFDLAKPASSAQIWSIPLSDVRARIDAR